MAPRLSEEGFGYQREAQAIEEFAGHPVRGRLQKPLR
jgi:hypothetical protein